MTASRSPDVTEQVEVFMRALPQYPGWPTRPIVDAVDVLAESGPTLGRPLVDRIELEPKHRTLIPLFGRRLKELRPLGTDIRILFTFAPDRTGPSSCCTQATRQACGTTGIGARFRKRAASTATTSRRRTRGDVMVTTKWSEIRGRLVPADQEEAAAEGRRALRDALGLARIRIDRKVTQVELAGRLVRSQGNISELERRSDVYLSSLREYIEALGGELEVNAVFDGRRHVIAARR